MRFLTVFLAGVLAVFTHSIVSAAYTPPVGIPDPATQWGGVQDPIDDPAPARPVPWTSEVAGYYYISDDEVGCSNTRTYGYPGYARCGIPQTIPAGSRVEIAGNYSMGNYSANLYIIANGTSGAFIAGVSGPVWVVGVGETRPVVSKKTYVLSSEYLYVDNIHFEFFASGDAIQIGSSSTEAYGQNTNITFRNCEIEGGGTNGALTHAFTISGYSQAFKPENILIYNSELHDHSYPTWYADNGFGDQDAHIIIVNQYTDNLWVLGNHLYNAAGTGVAIGQDSYTGDYRIDNAYVGRNHIHHCLQGAIATKGSTLAVFSENDMHNLYTRFESDWTAASYGKCIGYGDNTSGPLYYLNNSCHDAYFGVHGGGTAAGTPSFFIMGNVFYNIYSWEGILQLNPSGGTWVQSDSGTDFNSLSALYMMGATNATIEYNTFYNIEGGVYSGSVHNYMNIKNNIFANLRSPNSMAINFSGDPNILTKSNVDNNIISSSGNTYVARAGGTYYNTLADLVSGTNDCDNCSTADPKFVSSTNFRLQSDSPAKDAGVESSVYQDVQTLYGLNIKKDISGTVRPVGSAWDIGAYEYTDGGPSPIRVRGFRVSAQQ